MLCLAAFQNNTKANDRERRSVSAPRQSPEGHSGRLGRNEATRKHFKYRSSILGQETHGIPASSPRGEETARGPPADPPRPILQLVES